MVLIIFQHDILRLEVVEIMNIGIQFQDRRVVSLRQTGQLCLHSVHVVFIHMGIIDNMRKKSDAESAHLGNQVDKSRILRHIKRNAKTHIPRALDEHTI